LAFSEYADTEERKQRDNDLEGKLTHVLLTVKTKDKTIRCSIFKTTTLSVLSFARRLKYYGGLVLYGGN